MAAIKSRAFRIELYEETESYDFRAICDHLESCYDFVKIRHDKDTWSEDCVINGVEHKKGELKKPHWHYVIRWEKAPRTKTGLAKELGIDDRWILPCYGKDDSKTSLKGALLYLTHVDELEKYQYDFSEVSGKGNIENMTEGRLFRLWRSLVSDYYKLTDEEILLDISDYIASQENKRIYTRFFLIYACSHGWLSVCKKYSQFIYRMIDEHNANIWFVDKENI